MDLNATVSKVAGLVRPDGATQRASRSRAQKSEDVKAALFQAAAQVVGERGYQSASINRITDRAGLAVGTFYYHFKSRQEIFDQLLPVLGTEMLQFVRAEAGGAGTFVEKEERSFRAFFHFIDRMPSFLRILNEAELFAPAAHGRHLDNVTEAYLRFLRKYRAAGEVRDLSDEALDSLVHMLVAARAYLAMRHASSMTEPARLEAAVSAYMSLIATGISAKGATRHAAKLPRQPKPPTLPGRP